LNEEGTGYVIEPNPEYALKYYTKAKHAEFPRAYNNLGAFFIRGSDLPEEI